MREQPVDGAALVPIGARLKLYHLLAAALAQSLVTVCDPVDGIFYAGHVVLARLAVMNGDGEGLSLDPCAVDARERFVQFGLGRLDRLFEPLGFLGALGHAARPGNVEAVASGIDDTLDPDAVPQVGEIAAADDRHRAVLCQTLHGGAGLVGDRGIAIIPNDGRERAVKVEKDRGGARVETRVDLVDPVPDKRQPVERLEAIAAGQEEPAQVSRDKVGAMGAQGVAMCPALSLPVDADDEPEAPRGTGLDAGDGVFDHHGLAGAAPELLRGPDELVGSGLR